jgi:hypothetical protein
MSGLVVKASMDSLAEMMVDRLGSVGCKTALRLMERAVAVVGEGGVDMAKLQEDALADILEDLAGDEAAAERVCEVF